MAGQLIVVIDDEPAMVEMLRAYLRMKGYEVHGALSGLEGLALVEAEHPAALLLDLMLPDIDGFDLLHRLRANADFADLPVIMISARVDPAAQVQAHDAGVDAFLTKPVRFPDLLSTLEELLAD